MKEKLQSIKNVLATLPKVESVSENNGMLVVKDENEIITFVNVSEFNIQMYTPMIDVRTIESDAKKLEMYSNMLSANYILPLSSFAQVGEQIVLMGELSIDSTTEVIVEEFENLTSNVVEALEIVSA